MNRYLEHFRAILTPEDFQKLAETVFEMTAAADPDQAARTLLKVAEAMRSDGCPEEEIEYSTAKVAADFGVDLRRGYN